MRLSGRVKRLEGQCLLARACALCKGQGWPGFVLCMEGEPEPVPTGCRGCGRYSSLKKVILPADPDAPRGPDGRLLDGWAL